MKIKIILYLEIFIICLLLSSCHANINDNSSNLFQSIKNSSTQEFPSVFMIEKENKFDYQPGLECSAFASAYLLRHYDEKAEGLKLFETFPNKLPLGGVLPDGIVTFFNDKNYYAEFIYNASVDDLKNEISKGAPVIVFIHIEEPYTSAHNTHYIPIVGYDEEYFYFAESLKEFANCKDEKDLPYNRKTKIEKFQRLWSNIDGLWDNPYFKITKKE